LKNSKTPLESVGTAEMKEDGTLWLGLYANENGISGHALIVVKNTDKEYQMHLDHIGSIKPGEFKNIPPYPPRGFN
jgi:hypothetical protein